MEANTPPPEAMWSISRIAERDGVSKPTVSIHVKRLVERHGLTVHRDGQGRVSAVNVVEYDALRDRYADPSKVQAPPRAEDGAAALPPPSAAASGRDLTNYDEAQRRRAWLDVEKRRLEVGEQRGLLIRADRYGDAVGRCGDEMARLIDQLPQDADALAAELDLDDVHALRVALKALARRLRGELAGAFAALAAEAGTLDEPMADLETGAEA